MKSLHLFGLMVLAAATVYGEEPVYWSVSPPDCSAINDQTPVTINSSTGARLGYSCQIAGTFVWLAAGAGWTTAIRVAGPGSGSVAVEFTFYDHIGNNQLMDFTGSVEDSSDDVQFSLFDNQPSEIVLIGATVDAPHNYNRTATGSVYATFLCPDATTCLDLKPQLIYSALPSIPWSLSVPITWDHELSTTWSAVGIDNGGSKLVSFVVYNEDTIAHSYRIDVFDEVGNNVSHGFTPSILPLQGGEGGTYGDLLKNVVPNLPDGPFKIVVDGGPGGILSAVSFLQFIGPSATSLEVAFDSPPGSAALAKVGRRSSVRQKHVKSSVRRQVRSLPKKTAAK